MDTVLGLLGLVIYVVAVISVAAGMTWLTVRLTPAKKPQPVEPAA
jgi:hypothetical protein